MQVAPLYRVLFVVAWLLLAIGCETRQTRGGLTGNDPDIARAAQMMQAEQYLQAAELYRQMAVRTPLPERRSAMLLAAANASRLGGDWANVQSALEQLAALPKSGEQSFEYGLLQAEYALQSKRPTQAIDFLNADQQRVPSRLQLRYYTALADAYRQMGNPLEAANALQQVDALQSDNDGRLQTQVEILRTLTLLTDSALTNLQPSPPGNTGGWMELALLVKRYGTRPDELDQAMSAWRQRFPSHPALPELLTDYRDQLQNQVRYVERIAVLLPQSGVYANVAAAIRDGIVISRFQFPEDKRPELRFYDASDPAGLWPQYNQAVTDGAQLVIGPLQKESVAQLMRAGELPIPVLALNQVAIDSAPPTNLYMYSLSPEDEARQAAERIWLDGKRRPIILAPQDGWGDRLAFAFESRWRSLGGSVAGIGRYDPKAHDYTATITQLLHLDRSEARRQEMQTWLGRNVEFEPNRRDDIDAIFLAARPAQVQSIRPQLRYHQAANLPIYATSHAWTGRVTRSQVQDLRGVMLPEIPWLVTPPDPELMAQQSVQQYLPGSGSAYSRLYAMGMDSLRLAPHLGRLQASPLESLDGNTGNLYMDDSNTIHRQMIWVTLDSQPKVLGYSPRLDLRDNNEPRADNATLSAPTI